MLKTILKQHIEEHNDDGILLESLENAIYHANDHKTADTINNFKIK